MAYKVVLNYQKSSVGEIYSTDKKIICKDYSCSCRSLNNNILINLPDGLFLSNPNLVSMWV